MEGDLYLGRVGMMNSMMDGNGMYGAHILGKVLVVMMDGMRGGRWSDTDQLSKLSLQFLGKIFY